MVVVAGCLHVVVKMIIMKNFSKIIGKLLMILD